MLHIPAFPHLKESNPRTGFLEDSQYEKLVEGAELWFRTLVECAASIGWRHEELLSLRVRQVDLKHRILRLEPGTTKNGEGREAPMTDTMLQLLTACTEGKEPTIPSLPGRMASQSATSAEPGRTPVPRPAYPTCSSTTSAALLLAACVIQV